MCEVKPAPTAAASAASASAAPPRRRRLRIGEIDTQWHCTIIGTCLTLSELRSLAAKLRIAIPDGPHGYGLHAGMVSMASRDRATGKTLSKLLDRKHAPAISRFAQATDDAQLAALWSDALAKGEVAGACWAVMGHPAASEDLRQTLFQTIHMLSHQVGAATRADLRLIHGLEQEKAALEAKIARQQQRLRDEIRRRDQMIQELRQRLDCEMAESRQLAHAALAARELAELRDLTVDLRTRLEAETAHRQRAAAQRDDALAGLRRVAALLAGAQAENAFLTEENRACESRLLDRPTPDAAPGDTVAGCGADCAGLDLCGRCILFVGGHRHHLPHLRRLVEDSNGVFAHHDGGLEQNMKRLHGLFGQADVVLFPVDAVSHSAQDAVKQLCRRWNKPYRPVRRSGLGAYLLALSALAGAPHSTSQCRNSSGGTGRP